MKFLKWEELIFLSFERVFIFIRMMDFLYLKFIIDIVKVVWKQGFELYYVSECNLIVLVILIMSDNIY